MEVTINTEELFFDIKNKSHYEVSSIQDVNLRYIAEAGSEKTHEVFRCIIDAEAIVRLMCNKFVSTVEEKYAEQAPEDEGTATVASTTTKESINNIPEEVPTSFVYTFVDNPRRHDNRGQVLANSIHSAIVSMALSKFYVSVNQMELSQAHDALAKNAVVLLERMLYEKKQPSAPTWNNPTTKPELNS